jgi:hypothetical protein
MLLRSLFVFAVLAASARGASCGLTFDEIRARLEAAGYSQIREMPSGKIRTFKAVMDGREQSIVVDSNGHVRELQ